MNRPTRWYDYLTINIYFLGLTTLSQTMGLVMPLLIQQFVGEARQGAYYGTLRLWTLMVALLVQALMGMLSDRSTLRWGRRRPFIFVGTILNAALVALLGFLSGIEDITGYYLLFGLAVLMQFASNTAHGAEQGLIPDLVPENQRGRFSAVKAILDIPIPVIVVAFTVGRMIAKGNLWGGLITAIGTLLLTMLITMLVPEQPLKEKPAPINWEPFVRLLAMTAVFTLIILGSGEIVKQISKLLEAVESPVVLLTVMGLLGLGGMALAVALGVWLSVRISVGEAARQNPSFTWWVVNRLAFLVAMTNLSTFAVYFLQTRLGYVKEAAAKPASNLMMFVGIFILLTALPSGWLADHFGRKRLVAISGFLGALGVLIILLTPNLTVIYVGGVFVGLAAGLFYTANWALGIDLVPKAEAGRYLGLSNLAGAGAGAVGAYIGGPIADFFTRQAAPVQGLGYVLLFAIYLGMFLLSVLALTKVKDGGE